MPCKRPKKRPCLNSAPVVLKSPTKKKRKQWSNESMIASLEAVKNGLPVRKAAAQYGVPRTTLQDHVQGKVVHGKNPGPKPYLVPAEEKELSLFLVDVAQAGYGKIRQQVMTIAENVASDKGVLKPGRRLLRGWFERFMKRQP